MTLVSRNFFPPFQAIFTYHMNSECLAARLEHYPEEKAIENVIFIHGFLSSSSFWTESVFTNLSEHTKQNYRLFAIDLLGFGKSPKPRDCMYTLRDHLQMIEKSVIDPFQLNSFHVVAHSMGCVIAVALAAKYSESVKSITLVAPVSILMQMVVHLDLTITSIDSFKSLVNHF